MAARRGTNAGAGTGWQQARRGATAAQAGAGTGWQQARMGTTATQAGAGTRWQQARMGARADQAGAQQGTEAGVHGGVLDKKVIAFAGYLAIAGALLATAALLMYHLYRFVALEVALRRRSVPFTLYPPKGPAYPAGDVHTACAVCISDYRRFDRVAVLPACGHVFHRRCLRVEIAGESPRCPLCRAALA